MQVDLPWPPAALKPNGQHGHWSKKSGAAKSYRADCAIACRAAGLSPAAIEGAHLTIRFCPPDNRRRDLDNMLASFKQGIDAIAESIAVDDHRFGFTIVRGGAVKGGNVNVTITEMEAF